MSPELQKFKHHFETFTRIRVLDVIEERQYFHWKRLVFKEGLNCEELNTISNYIKNTFSQKDLYSHLLPKLVVCDNKLCLTVDVKEIKRCIK